MNIEQAIALVDQILGSNGLNDLQEQVFRRVWEKEKYPEIADALGYDSNYIKDSGARMWKKLSTVLDEKVTKSNIHRVLRRHAQPQLSASLQVEPSEPKASQPGTPVIDWEESVDTSSFMGRDSELTQLASWLQDSQCRLIAITGIAGIGKTALAAQFIEQYCTSYDRIIWRSLKHPKPLSEFLTSLLQGSPVVLDTTTLKTVSPVKLLLDQLKQYRCLIVLDGIEMLLKRDRMLGDYHPDYEAYHDLFQQLSTANHASTVLATCREKPKTWILLEDSTPAVRSHPLAPLSVEDTQHWLTNRGLFSGRPNDWATLTEQYGGNPLALQIVAANILDFFEGNITDFLDEGQVVFEGLSAFLQQQWSALSSSEQWILYYLAMRREAVSFKAIKSDLLDSSFQRRLTEVLGVLTRRSLIIKQGSNFSLQTAIAEYVTFQLTQAISQELLDSELHLMSQLPLLKASRQDYLQTLQKQQLLQPLLDQLKSTFAQDAKISQHLQSLIQHCREEGQSYSAGNLVNLLIQLGLPLSKLDLSGLPLWEVNFSAHSLHQVDLSHCDLSRTQFSHAFSGVTSVAFYPEEDDFITGHEDGLIMLWNDQGRQLLSLTGHKSWVWDLCWTPNGESLVSVSEDQSLRVWDVATGDCSAVLEGHGDRIWRVVCPQDYIAVSCSSDQTLKVWDLEQGICLRTLSGHDGDIMALALGAESHVLSGGADQTLRLWNYETGELLETWNSVNGSIWAITYSSSSETIYSAGDRGIIAAWKCKMSQPISFLGNKSERIWSLGLSPCEQYLIAGGESHQFVRWNLLTSTIDKVIPGYEGRIWSTDYASNGDRVITASEDNRVYLWNIHQGNPLLKLTSYSNWACDVVILPSQDGETSIISAHEDGAIYHWSFGQTTDTKRCTGHLQSTWAIASNPAGTHVVSGSEDNTLRIWDVESGHCQSTLKGHQRQIWSVAWSPDGQTIASGSGDRTVKLWNASSSQCVANLEGHRSRVWTVAFSPDSQMIASGSGDRTLRLWHRQTGDCSAVLEGHSSQILAVKFNPTVPLLASAGGRGECILWNLNTHKPQILSLPIQMIWSMAWSPDGQMLAVGGDDGSIHLWNQESQTWATPISSQSGCIWAIAFGPDGRTICSGSQDGTIRRWDVKTQTYIDRRQPERLYEGMTLMDAQGLTAAQIQNLERLGAQV